MFKVPVVRSNKLCRVLVLSSKGRRRTVDGTICLGKLQSCLKLWCLVIAILFVVNSYLSVRPLVD